MMFKDRDVNWLLLFPSIMACNVLAAQAWMQANGEERRLMRFGSADALDTVDWFSVYLKA